MQTPDVPAPPLSPPLDQLLQRLPDSAFAQRLRRVYLAAAQAIHRLGDMDLVKYESASTTESAPDLSLWEEMAPVIRDTVMDVNALLNVVREEFPQPVAGGLADILSRMADEVGPEARRDVLHRRVDEATRVLHEGMEELAQQITQLGEAMRSPSVVSDRWNLLAEIQSFRARFRDVIGRLVFESASTFDEVTRQEVIPGYSEDVSSAVGVRATVADLRRVIGSRLEKVREADPEDVLWHAQQLSKELDTFGRTTAYRSLRAQDKRRTLESRTELTELVKRPKLTRLELAGLLEGLKAFVDDLSNINQRQLLVTHDRELMATCGVKLEQSTQLLDTQPLESARVLAEAAAAAQSLYGLDNELDAFLRRIRRTKPGTLQGPELKQTIETFRELLANLPLS